MGAALSLMRCGALTVPERCDVSPIIAGRTEKIKKLPPGGGRAAAGGSTRPSAAERVNSGNMPAGSQWIAVKYVGGAEHVFLLSKGKRTVRVSGLLALSDALAHLDDWWHQQI